MTSTVASSLALKPRLRGVLHQWAFAASAILGVLVLVVVPDGRPRFAAAVYTGSVTALFGASALYHRVSWRRPSVRRWMRRLDHSMIFVLIAGTYTPFALVKFDDALGRALLIAVWGGAAGGIVLKLVWIDAPKWLGALIYVVLGWVTVVTFPALVKHVGVIATCLVALGGVLYTTGAVVYATRRPDPSPTVFGYHEVFHLLVVLAAALQYAVVVFWVLL